MSTDVFRIKRAKLIEKIRATYDEAKRVEKEYEDGIESVKNQAASIVRSKIDELIPNVNIWGDTVELEYKMSIEEIGLSYPERPDKSYHSGEYAAMLQAIEVLECSDSEYVSQTVANKFLKFV
jgi:vacuolar-type H+-ATPase subunit D/Vma8